jgi:hypothetical protein
MFAHSDGQNGTSISPVPIPTLTELALKPRDAALESGNTIVARERHAADILAEKGPKPEQGV